MTMLIDQKRLWNDEGYGEDNPLENTIKLITRTGEQLGLPKEVAESVINKTFIEMSQGQKWPRDKCPCGCGIDKSGTAITHYMLDELRKINAKMTEFKRTTMQDALNNAIIQHITYENNKYIAEAMKPTILQKIWTFLNKEIW